MPIREVTADLDEIREAMRNAKSAERPKRKPSLREAVHALLPEIEDLRKAKWSDADIAEWFGKRGMNISAGTLAQYVREARKSGPTRSAVRSSNGSREKASTPPKLADGVPPSSEPKAEPKSAVNAVPVAGSDTKPNTVPNAAGATTKRRVNDDA